MKLSGVEIDLLFARLSSMTEAAMVTGGKTVETLDLDLMTLSDLGFTNGKFEALIKCC